MNLRSICMTAPAVLAAFIFTATVPLNDGALAQKRGGTLIVATETGHRGFDAPSAGVINGSVAMTMVQYLFGTDAVTQEPIPMLGLSMTASKDRKSWTIKTRRGVRFSDGTPFNAAAVAFNYNRIRASKCRCRAFIATIVKVEATDEDTVVFHLKHPWAAFRSAVSGPAIYSYIHSPTAIKKMGDKVYNRNPVGTGPFTMLEWRSGDRVTVVRNPNYWGKAPYLDKVIFRVIPDTETRYASLLSGDVDAIWTDRANHILKARKRSDVVVLRNEGNGALTIFLNNAKPPLDDVRVRKAMQLAFDTDRFNKAIRKGVNPTAYHPFGPKFNCPGFQYPKPDLVKARQLIKAYGKPVKVIYTHTTTARGREGALISQSFWNKIGVETVMDPVDQTTLIRKVVTGDYQISGWRIVEEIDPYVDIQIVGTFYSKSPANYAHYKNPMMDKLVLGGRVTENPQKRAAMYCGVAKLIAAEVPILYRGGLVRHVLTRPDVKGVPVPYGGLVNTLAAWLDR